MTKLSILDTAFTTKLLTLYSSLAVFLFLSLALILPSGYSYGAAMLFLAGLFFVFKQQSWVMLNKQDWLLGSVLAVFSLVWMLEAWIFGYGISGFDKPFRFVAAIVAMFCLIQYPPKLAFFWFGAALGSILTGVYTVKVILFDGLSRVELGYTTAIIQFGNTSILLAFLSLAGLGWAVSQRKKYFWISLLLFGFLMGLVASVLSGTRGGWIAIPFALLIIYRGLSSHFQWRHVFVGSVLLVFTLVFIYTQPSTGVKERVDLAVAEVKSYYQQGVAATSVGSRLEMWRGGLIIVADNPIYGVGTLGYQQRKSALIQEGELDPFVEHITHLHNEYLERFVKFGLIGLFALILLFFLPLRVFLSYFQHPCLNVRALASAGAVLSVCYIDFSLTHSPLRHNIGVMIFAFTLIVISVLLKYALVNYNSGQNSNIDSLKCG
ncbi:O-antigen ligase family protein [Thiomicrospira microaerophila]|uniref:O-antigen ligase family protein n=1 Tax=Thiomicrospira microaerophila TaxID=406020 RepID=UPI0005C89CE8|nr:O-antigen ligase family protein [Thiomicrospira microaerophila]